MKPVKIISRFLTIVVFLSILAAGCAPSGEKPAKIEVKPKEQAPIVAAETIKPKAEPEKQIPKKTAPTEMAKPTEIVKPAVEPPPQPSAKAEAGVELTLKFSQGDSTTYKVITEAQRKMKGEGALLEDDKFKGGTTGNRAEITFTQQIQSVDAQGNAVAKITINELKYSAKVKDNVTTDFDSSREKDRNSPLYKLIGQSYTIELTPEGQVSKIIDCSQAQAAVSGSSSAGEAASMLLKPEAIKLRHTIPALPAAEKNQLRQGDSWSNVKPFSFGMMGSKSYERIYTLNKIEDADNRRTALVEMSARPSAETAEEPNQVQAMGIFSKMFDNTENYTGGLKLDLNSGKVKEYSEKLQSEWIAVDPSAGQKEQGQPATLRMTATHFYHLEKID